MGVERKEQCVQVSAGWSTCPYFYSPWSVRSLPAANLLPIYPLPSLTSPIWVDKKEYGEAWGEAKDIQTSMILRRPGEEASE